MLAREEHRYRAQAEDFFAARCKEEGRNLGQSWGNKYKASKKSIQSYTEDEILAAVASAKAASVFRPAPLRSRSPSNSRRKSPSSIRPSRDSTTPPADDLEPPMPMGCSTTFPRMPALPSPLGISCSELGLGLRSLMKRLSRPTICLGSPKAS